MARYWMGTELTRIYGSAFPWGTWGVNVLGSFVIGLAATWADQAAVRFFVVVGLCGGFTTFSSFSLETLNLLRLGEWQKGLGYIAISVVVCAIWTWLGSVVGRRLA
jgi:CrcB protein